MVAFIARAIMFRYRGCAARSSSIDISSGPTDWGSNINVRPPFSDFNDVVDAVVPIPDPGLLKLNVIGAGDTIGTDDSDPIAC